MTSIEFLQLEIQVLKGQLSAVEGEKNHYKQMLYIYDNGILPPPNSKQPGKVVQLKVVR